MPSQNTSRGEPDRRELLSFSAFFGSAFLARQGLADTPAVAAQLSPTSTPVRGMKKSINLWAFPYPDKWSLQECFQIARDAGFDAVEPNFNLEGEFSAESTDDEIRRVKRMADDAGIAISGVCSFLFWPYSMTHPDPQRRARGIELAGRMAEAAALLGTDNLLVVPGAVYAPWLEDPIPVPNDVCERLAREAVQALIPRARRAGVTINIENIFANGFLFSPQEMAAFVDSFESDTVKVHFDTGNIMQYQFPEHWDPDSREADQERPPEGVGQAHAGIQPQHVSHAARRDHGLAGGDPGAGGSRIRRLPHVRVLPSVRALPGGADLPDIGRARPHPAQERLKSPGRRELLAMDQLPTAVCRKETLPEFLARIGIGGCSRSHAAARQTGSY